MRKSILILSILLLVSFGSADVFHEIEVEDEYIELNSSVNLECSGENCPVNRWNLDWDVPENSELLFINDSWGKVDNYDLRDGKLEIQTNRAPSRKKETLKIGFSLERDRNEIKGIERIDMELPGFREDNTTGVLESDNIASYWFSPGFNISYGEDEIGFQGEGPVNLRLNRGEGTETNYYEFFGEKVESPDQSYMVASGVTGRKTGYGKIPVIMLEDSEYDSEFSDWSSGEYSRGLIAMRKSLENNTKPVLTHETVHALNDRFLDWDRTDSTYFDEATATYADFLMRKKLFSEEETDVKPREVFGDGLQYPVKRNGETFIISINSRGNQENLWNYYDEGSEWMKNWNVEDRDRRTFGYAYSQLMAMNHVVERGNISGLYRRIDPGRRVVSEDEKWELLGNYMDMEPCKRSEREEFEKCIENLNSHEYSFVRASPDFGEEDVQIERIQLDERELESAQIDLKYHLQNLAIYLRKMVSNLLEESN